MNVYQCYLDLKEKKMSSVELTQSCLQRLKASQNNALISITAEMALAQAAQADECMARREVKGPLQGIPYTLKDIFITKGIRTTAGSKMLANYIPPYDGLVSAALKQAGGVMIGKANLDEFAMGSSGETSAFGATKNPLDPRKVPGGSSSGSAASVAEGLALYSIGTDTGGSIRLPANFCGLVGFRPSYGRISRYGQIAFASSLDQASPVASSVLDIALIMEAITTPDARDATKAALPPMAILDQLLPIAHPFLKGKRIGLSQKLMERCESEVRREIERALTHLEAMGVHLVEVDFPHFEYVVPTYCIIAFSEASANLARYDGIHYGLGKRHGDGGNLEDSYVKSRSEGFGAEVKRRILLGTYSLSSGHYEAYYTKACKVRRLISEDFQNNFKRCDVILSPVCATTAFDLGKSREDSVKNYLNDIFTIPANLAGLPALALPFGHGREKLPTGFQLMGPQFADEAVLKIGWAMEQALRGVT